jgi:hypothetical protein
MRYALGRGYPLYLFQEVLGTEFKFLASIGENLQKEMNL